MIDQLIIGEKASYDDFEANVKERKIGAPKKKSIKETVPFSNETYDFTAINGEIYWEERTLEYIFEITANTPEELEEKKRLFTSWVMNVMNKELHDPFILDYHFIATFDSIDMDDSEIEKSTITVTFTAFPYMLANSKKVYKVDMVDYSVYTLNVVNDSSHRITPKVVADAPFMLLSDNGIMTFSAGEITDGVFVLAVGVNTFEFVKKDGNATLTIEFREEVL